MSEDHSNTKAIEAQRVEVVRVAEKQVRIPQDWSLWDAANWLTEKAKEADSPTAVTRMVRGWPTEIAARLWTFICSHWSEPLAVSGSGTISVRMGNRTIDVPTEFRTSGSGVPATWYIVADTDDGRPCLHIEVATKQMFKGAISNILDLFEDKSVSLYKSCIIKWGKKAGERRAKLSEAVMEAPIFEKIDPLTLGDCVFHPGVEEAIRAEVLTPLDVELCEQAGVPTKRGILLHGPYGVGKSLLGRVIATEAVRLGWAFVVLDDERLLPTALDVLRDQPTVIWVEDIDSVASGDSKTRDSNLNALLNALDGVDSSNKTMLIATSNYSERLYEGLMRPGRLDSCIRLPRPGADEAERLINLYAPFELADNIDLTRAGELLAGLSAAHIREAVERAKLYALNRGAKTPLSLTSNDLTSAAKSVRSQVNDLKTDSLSDDSPNPQVTLHEVTPCQELS